MSESPEDVMRELRQQLRSPRRGPHRAPVDVGRQALIEATERLARSNAERRRQRAEAGGASSPVPQLSPDVPKKYREVRKALSAAGWTRLRQSGSHEVWSKPGEAERIVVAGRDGDTIATGTLARIRRISGLEELR